MRLYGVKDDIIGFGTVAIFDNDEVAKRAMAQTVAEGDNNIAKWPKDFSIWYLGEIDKVDGHLTEVQPQRVCYASEFIRKEVSNNDIQNPIHESGQNAK